MPCFRFWGGGGGGGLGVVNRPQIKIIVSFSMHKDIFTNIPFYTANTSNFIVDIHGFLFLKKKHYSSVFWYAGMSGGWNIKNKKT